MITDRLIKLPVQFVNSDQLDLGMDEDNVDTYDSYIYVFVSKIRAFGPANPINHKDSTLLYFTGDSDAWIIPMPTDELTKLVMGKPSGFS